MITDNNSNADSELEYRTAIPKKNNSFKYLGHVVTLLYILGCFVCSQLVMYLDQARIAAYAIFPIIIIAKYLNDSGVSWTSSKKSIFLSHHRFSLVFAYILDDPS